MGQIAIDTEGYSGADLQAIVYNAQLEVVHASITDTPPPPSKSKGKGKATEADGAIATAAFRVVAPAEQAERSASELRRLTKRVRPDLTGISVTDSQMEAIVANGTSEATSTRETARPHRSDVSYEMYRQPWQELTNRSSFGMNTCYIR